jgi:hypothetical protein
MFINAAPAWQKKKRENKLEKKKRSGTVLPKQRDNCWTAQEQTMNNNKTTTTTTTTTKPLLYHAGRYRIGRKTDVQRHGKNQHMPNEFETNRAPTRRGQHQISKSKIVVRCLVVLRGPSCTLVKGMDRSHAIEATGKIRKNRRTRCRIKAFQFSGGSPISTLDVKKEKRNQGKQQTKPRREPRDEKQCANDANGGVDGVSQRIGHAFVHTGGVAADSVQYSALGRSVKPRHGCFRHGVYHANECFSSGSNGSVQQPNGTDGGGHQCNTGPNQITKHVLPC